MSDDSNRFKIDPTLVKQISDSKKQNYGHAIAKMFNDLGTIENDKKVQELNGLKIQDYKDSRQNVKDNEDLKTKTAKLQYQSVSDTLADDKKYLNFVKSGETYDNWTSSGNSFATSKYGDKAKAFGDTKISLMNDNDIKYNVAQANRLFVKDGVFDEVGFYNHMDTQLTNKKINQDVYADVIDGVNKNRKGGIYAEYVKPETTSEIKNYEYKIKNPDFKIKSKDEQTLTVDQKNYNAEMKATYGDDKTKYDNFADWRVTEKQSKKLTGEATYNQIVNKQIDIYSDKLETTNFADIDFNQAVIDKKITSNDKRRLERTLASSREAKNLENKFGKTVAEYATMEGMAKRFAKASTSKNVNTDVIQNAMDVTKSYVPNFEPSKEELENFEFRSDFLNFSGVILKLKSGLTVSEKERVQFEKSMGTLFKNKKVNFIGIKQQLIDRRNALDGVKSMAPEYYNIKYGHLSRSLDGSIGIIDGYLKGEIKEKTGDGFVPPEEITGVIKSTENNTTPTVVKSSDFKNLGIKVGY